MPIFDELLTTADFARRIDRTPDRVRQLARAGRIRPAIVASSGQAFYTPEEVARYQQETQPQQPTDLAPVGVAR